MWSLEQALSNWENITKSRFVKYYKFCIGKINSEAVQMHMEKHRVNDSTGFYVHFLTFEYIEYAHFRHMC